MNVLLVAPVEVGSGETVTARYLCRMLVRHGHHVAFLASSFAAGFLRDEFAESIRALGADGPANVALWSETIRMRRPDVIVFADYPLMFWRTGVSPLAREPGWVESMLDLNIPIVTLDHFGFAQGPMGLFFGPPHLTHEYHRCEEIPSRMHIMLPCPMHGPGSVPGRRGEPFRYWDVPLGISVEARGETRRRYLRHSNELLVLHIVSNWAWKSAETLGLSFYRHLGPLLLHYLASLSREVTVVSVNNGALLGAASLGGARLIDLSPMTPPEFDQLAFSADLLLTENMVSISMGKAVCGLQPAAVLKNSHGILELLDRTSGRMRELVCAMEHDRAGTVYPYDVYPTDMREMLQSIVLYRGNSLTQGFAKLEVFGGAETEAALSGLLTDSQIRAALRARQLHYVEQLRAVDDGATVLERLTQH